MRGYRQAYDGKPSGRIVSPGTCTPMLAITQPPSPTPAGSATIARARTTQEPPPPVCGYLLVVNVGLALAVGSAAGGGHEEDLLKDAAGGLNEGSDHGLRHIFGLKQRCAIDGEIEFSRHARARCARQDCSDTDSKWTEFLRDYPREAQCAEFGRAVS